MSINATPFNPTFKLIGNLQEDQVLVYDTTQGAFVNANGTASPGSDGSGIDSVSHIGVGNQLGSVTRLFYCITNNNSRHKCYDNR